MKTRLTKEEWTDLGLRILGEEGPEGLTVDAICDAAQRTRGSLYHHFQNIDDLLMEILERWRQKHTEDLIATVESNAVQPSGQPVYLNTLAFALNSGIERNVRRLVARRPTLRFMVAAVDTKRVEFLSELMRRDLHMEAMQADLLAQVEYAAWIGFLHLEPEPDHARLTQLYQAFSEIILQTVQTSH